MSRLNNTRGLIELLLLAVVIIVAIVFMISYAPRKGDVVVYNCSLAEISPDIPLEVKEKCRKLRAEKL